MSARRRGRGTGLNTVLIVAAIVAFVWGLERWRQRAASRAGGAESGRLGALARCMLGADGTTLMHSPDASRRRLRALALGTPSEASVTWFDRCLPIAHALMVHATEVDNTRAVTAAATRVAEGSQRLYDAMVRVGLVWRVRAGDPELDMDLVGDRLAVVASEIELAAGDRVRGAGDAPEAPAPVALADGALIETPGLEPAPLGAPDRFWVGAPMPSLTEVRRDGSGYHLDTRTNVPSVAWRLSATGLVRVDALLEPTRDGLAPLEWFTVNAPPSGARVSPVNDPLEGLHVALDGTTSGAALWLAQWTPWTGTSLARFAPGREATAVNLAAAPPGAAVQARDPVLGRTTVQDERVAVTTLGSGAVVAYTSHREAEHTSTVSVASTLADSDRAAVVRLGEVTLEGHPPGVEFCPASDHLSAALVIAGALQWSVVEVSERGVHTRVQSNAPRGAVFDTHAVVRCTPQGDLLVYGRDHARGSPLIACHPEADPCTVLSFPAVPTLNTLPTYTTRTRSGRQQAHAEWPLVAVASGTTIVSARAAGPVVSISRRVDGAWGVDHVVFDAARATHGRTVEGVDLYADDSRIALAVASADGLHVLTSDDRGATWH